jgi:hypothetical protein
VKEISDKQSYFIKLCGFNFFDYYGYTLFCFAIILGINPDFYANSFIYYINFAYFGGLLFFTTQYKFPGKFQIDPRNLTQYGISISDFSKKQHPYQKSFYGLIVYTLITIHFGYHFLSLMAIFFMFRLYSFYRYRMQFVKEGDRLLTKYYEQCRKKLLNN